MNLIEALQNNGFAMIDYAIVVLYIILLVGLGFFLSRSKDGKEKSSNDYFLAGNTLTWWAVGASLIAANISAEQFIGMSGSAFASGIAIAAYELMAAAVTEDAYASKTRLTITVRIKYTDNRVDGKNIDQSFSAYRDFDSSEMLTDVQDELCQQITKELVDLIFNATLGNW